MIANLELVLDGTAIVGEGPIWDDSTNRLVWVDIPAGAVNLFDPTTGRNTTFSMGQSVGVAVLGQEKTLVVACADGFYLLDTTSGKSTLLVHVEADQTESRMNDGACDAAGRLWAGTMSDKAQPGVGSLYRFDTDRGVTRMLTDLTISNGIGWSLDNSRMYYIDSATQKVDVFNFELESGTLSNRTTLVEIRPVEGMPDGLTVDAEDCLWVALWGGAAIRRYTNAGELLAHYDLPVEFVSACGFGGPDYSDLYITTARYTLTPEALKKQPGAGSLFRLRPGVRGRAAFRWGGR